MAFRRSPVRSRSGPPFFHSNFEYSSTREACFCLRANTGLTERSSLGDDTLPCSTSSGQTVACLVSNRHATPPRFTRTVGAWINDVRGEWRCNTLHDVAKTRATPQDRWHGELSKLLRPLTRGQTIRIGRILPPGQAAQFLEDWPRVTEVGWWYAKGVHAVATSTSNTPGQRVKQQKSLTSALTALDDAAHQIARYVAHWGPVRRAWFPFETHDSPEAFSGAMMKFIHGQRERVEWFRQQAGRHPARPANRGRPTSPQTFGLEVLLAYFRHHHWDATIPSTDWANDEFSARVETPFVRVAFAVLQRTAMMGVTRKALAESSLSYVDLEGRAPRLTPEDRMRLWM